MTCLRRVALLVCALALLSTSSLVSAQELSPAFKTLLAGNIGAHALDLGTTIHALRQDGLREGNPALGWAQDRPVVMGATMTGLVGLSTWGKTELYRRHPKAAWVWVIAETAAISWVASHNHRLASARASAAP